MNVDAYVHYNKCYILSRASNYPFHNPQVYVDNIKYVVKFKAE